MLTRQISHDQEAKRAQFFILRSVTQRRSSKDSINSSAKRSSPQAIKITVEKLTKKGVLVEILLAGSDNYKRFFSLKEALDRRKINKVFHNTSIDEVCFRRASKWAIELSSSERRGIFHVRVVEGKDCLGEFSVDFQVGQCFSKKTWFLKINQFLPETSQLLIKTIQFL